VRPEEIKHDPSKFGGRQYGLLSLPEIGQRLCVAEGCGNPGYTQSAVSDDETPDQLRLFIVCQEHALAAALSLLFTIKDPDAIQRGAAIAANYGVDWNLYLHKSVEVSLPNEWRCALCGGQMAPETAGMFKGQRWVHTCGITTREATKLKPSEIDKLVMVPVQTCPATVSDPASEGKMFWQCTREDHGDDKHEWPHPLAYLAYAEQKKAAKMHVWGCKLDTDHDGDCLPPDGDEEPVRTAYPKGES
jgi:hypothetical protein